MARDKTLARVLKLRRLDLEGLQGRMGEADARTRAAVAARAAVSAQVDELPRPGTCPSPPLLFARLDALTTKAEQLAADIEQAASDRARAETEALLVRAECEGIETFLKRQAQLRHRTSKWR
ncbi:MAG: hypothetical protein FJX21_06195 [Alphaproteobacteria bacterium]|nr:hypothetical protein [Alphaproteobacteria bacterium]